MRLLIAMTAIAALTLSANAQGQRPATSPSGAPRQQQPQQPPPQQQAQPPQQQAPAPQPGMFACRTEQEICYIAIALPGNQVTVLYTNHEQAEGIDQKPQAVAGPSGPLDISQHAGRVIMMVGQYNAQTGITGEIVDVAGPLLSFSIKSQLSGGGDDEEEPEPPPPPQKPQQQQRPQQQQPRR